jgi:hypothetical protein
MHPAWSLIAIVRTVEAGCPEPAPAARAATWRIFAEGELRGTPKEAVRRKSNGESEPPCEIVQFASSSGRD